MNDIKIYDSSSIPKGNFFHEQWAKQSIILDGEVFSSEIENLNLEVLDDMKLDSVPHLDEEYSFSVKLSEKEANRLRKMLWLDKIEWLTHQMSMVWKDKFFKA